MNVCMAATYDPDPKAPLGFRLPFNLETGEMLEARWKNWLKHDPIRLVGRYAANLRTLRGIYIDCGWRDQYHIHYGDADPLAAARRSRHPAHLRGIRRQSLRRRLPDGREPAVSLSGAQAVDGGASAADRSDRDAGRVRRRTGLIMRWGDFRRSDNVEDRTGGARGWRRISGRRRHQARRRRAGRHRDREPDLRRQSAGDDRDDRKRRSARAAGAPQPSAPGLRSAARAGAGRRAIDRRAETRPRISPPPCSATPRTCGAPSSRRWARATCRRGSCCSATRRDRRAATRRPRPGPFYCSADRELYLDTAFFGVLAQPVRRARRIRAGLRDRPRSRPSRAEPDRDDGEGRPADAAGGRARTQCAVGAARAAGRLLCRRLGLFRAAPQQARDGRPRGRAPRRRRRRRRPDPEDDTQGYVVPESFTHGSAEQRQRWFRAGLESGDIRSCNTFAALGP